MILDDYPYFYVTFRPHNIDILKSDFCDIRYRELVREPVMCPLSPPYASCNSPSEPFLLSYFVINDLFQLVEAI